jgi:chemotaxis signal transduction protein
VLSIRVGREAYALRLSEVGALEADKTITRVPSEHAALLGIAGVRGLVVAVFDLAALLGVARPDGARWIVLAKGAPLALAFSGFEGQLSARPDQFARAEQGAGVREVLRHEGLTLPLVDIPALVTSLDPRQLALAGKATG